MPTPEIHYARNGDVALAYQVLGDGPMDLVFLPAFINNIEIAWESPHYARFLQRLASFARLIFMDRRGTGLSDRLSPTDLPPLEILMDDLVVVLDAVGSERVALFGSSNSGSLCAIFAATFPDRVSALALYGVAAAGVASDDYPWQWTTDEWDEYLRELADGWGVRTYAERMVPLFHPSLAHDESHIDWWARFMRQAASPNSAEAIERIWQQVDIRRILPTIQVPTLVIHRTDDQVEAIEAGRDVANRIQASRFLELPGGDDEPWGADQDTVLDEVEQFMTGKRHVQDVDRVLATVLFTDIVGSTELAARLGDNAWKELLADHDERAQAEIKRHRGIYVDSTGDGLLAKFDGPARAVRCAQAIGQALRPLGIQIRAGCHTGEIELAGTDIRGIAVHIGARVASLAGNAEVWTSSTVKDLVAGSGLVFEDAGEHELKGVPDRWHLYRVVS